MKKSREQFLLTSLALGLVFILAASANASSLASDSAADPAYNSGWTNGSNGGSGWGSAWSLNFGSGFSIASSATNGNGDNGSPGGGISGDGDINSAGRAWGIAGDTGSLNASRDFSGGLAIGQTFTIQMDTGFIEDNGVDSMGLFSSAGGIFIRIQFTGGTNNYIVQDGANNFDTGIPFTDEGLNISLTLTGMTGSGAFTYDLSMNTLGGSPFTLSSFLNVPAPSAEVERVVLTNNAAGTGATNILFFNNMAIVPEPSALALMSVGGIAAAFWRFRRRS